MCVAAAAGPFLPFETLAAGLFMICCLTFDCLVFDASSSLACSRASARFASASAITFDCTSGGRTAEGS